MEAAVHEVTSAEEIARRLIGEADGSTLIDEQEAVAEGIEQAVAFLAGLFEVV